jgi:acyl transferase domain-containing protein
VFLLEDCYHAIESASFRPIDLSGKSVGVFVGIYNDDAKLVQSQLAEQSSHFATSTSISIAAGRISFFFGLNGPAVAVDTACSSSLVALHLAASSIRLGDSERCLSCGVNIVGSSILTSAFAKMSMLSPDNRCKTFDRSANGYVRSEGSAVFFLEREEHEAFVAKVVSTGINQGRIESEFDCSKWNISKSFAYFLLEISHGGKCIVFGSSWNGDVTG